MDIPEKTEIRGGLLRALFRGESICVLLRDRIWKEIPIVQTGVLCHN